MTIDGCKIFGAVYLVDASVKMSLYLSRTLIIQPWDIDVSEPGDGEEGQNSEADVSASPRTVQHAAIAADRLHVDGRLSISRLPNAMLSAVAPISLNWPKIKLVE
ncbi:MAG: hypothetical protein AAGJ87_15925, partial [Pseudomonadota bacterium]